MGEYGKFLIGCLLRPKDLPLCFDITPAANGDHYLMRFVRNDKGVIDKCLMAVQGIEVEGLKIIK